MIFLIVRKRIRNISAVFAWQIHTDPVPKTEFVHIIFPGLQTLTYVANISVIDCQTECIAKKRVTGMCNSQTQVCCMAWPIFKAFDRMFTGQVYSQAWITARLGYHTF